MAANGGIIGKINNPTKQASSGIWDIRSVYTSREIGTWPLMPLPISLLTNTSVTGAGTAITLAYPTDLLANDLLFIVGTHNTQTAAPTGPSGWTIDNNSIYDVSFSKLSTGLETGSVTWTLDTSTEYAYIMVRVRLTNPSTIGFISAYGGYSSSGDGLFTTADAFSQNISGKINLYLYHAYAPNDATISSVTSNLTLLEKIGTGSRLATFYYGLNIGINTDNIGITISGTVINRRLSLYTF